MDKSPEAFRTISEVAETLDVPPHVLRFWETRFAQVKPVKRGGGRRYYRPEDVRLLRGIKGLLYEDGLTIKGVQKVLRERGVRHVVGLGTPSDEVEPASASGTTPATQPKPEPERAAANGAKRPGAKTHRQPQADLFEGPEPGPAAIRPEVVKAAAENKAALKALLGELEALRAEMLAERRR